MLIVCVYLPHMFCILTHITRGDYKIVEMIEQKPSIAIFSLNLVGHPYIALKR